MGKCSSCGNEYDQSFTIRMEDGSEHIFDSFECAIHMLAPICEHCGAKIIGHGVQQDDMIFCCAHCAKHAGVTGLRDRV